MYLGRCPRLVCCAPLGLDAMLLRVKSHNPPPTRFAPSRSHFVWFWTLSWPYNGSVLPGSKVIVLFHLCIFSRHTPTSEGVIPTKQGGILTKQANLRPYFARTGPYWPAKCDKSPVFDHRMDVFASFLRFALLPNLYIHPQEVFWCIWIMDWGPKSRVRYERDFH